MKLEGAYLVRCDGPRITKTITACQSRPALGGPRSLDRGGAGAVDSVGMGLLGVDEEVPESIARLAWSQRSWFSHPSSEFGPCAFPVS